MTDEPHWGQSTKLTDSGVVLELTGDHAAAAVVVVSTSSVVCVRRGMPVSDRGGRRREQIVSRGRLFVQSYYIAIHIYILRFPGVLLAASTNGRTIHDYTHTSTCTW